MKHQYPIIASAVAAALTAAGYVHAAGPPSLTSAESPTASLVIAGSSAAQTSVANAIENDICGGVANTLVMGSSGNKNFFAYSCSTTATIGVVPANSVVTIYYRTEGGSVVGALPIAANSGAVQVKRLLLNSSCSVNAGGTAGTCGVTGVTATSGPNDSWSGNVTADYVQLGVTDVEPAQLTNGDYPSGYSTTAFGSASPAQLAALSPVRAIQQVFGLGVNTSGLTLATAGVVNLSRESVANIEDESYTDWSKVPDALTGQAISSSPAAITRVDREPGSGTRTSANIYFFNYQCGGPVSITSNPGEALNYSTTDELTAANTIPGAIAYASIDNLLPPKNTSFTNLVLATLSGVTPSTLAAAAGQYDYWFEATLVPNSNTTAVPSGGGSAALSSFLQTDVPKLAKAPIAADINVIPNVAGNGAGTVPLTSRTGTISGTFTGTIYLNPFTRSGNSCNVPAETN